MTPRNFAAHVTMGILLTAGLLASSLTVYAQSESCTDSAHFQQGEKEREQALNDRDLAMAPIKSQHDLTDYLDLPLSGSPLAGYV